ncbi:E6 protein [Salmon gill poxvirus]
MNETEFFNELLITNDFTDINIEHILNLKTILSKIGQGFMVGDTATENHLILLSHFYKNTETFKTIIKHFLNPGVKFYSAWNEFPDYLIKFVRLLDGKINTIIENHNNIIRAWPLVNSVLPVYVDISQNPLLNPTVPTSDNVIETYIDSTELKKCPERETCMKMIWLYNTQKKYKTYYNTDDDLFEIFHDNMSIPVIFTPMSDMLQDSSLDHVNFYQGIKNKKLFKTTYLGNVASFDDAVVSIIDHYVNKGVVTDNMLKFFWSTTKNPGLKDFIMTALSGWEIGLYSKLEKLDPRIKKTVEEIITHLDFFKSQNELKFLLDNNMYDQKVFCDNLANVLLSVNPQSFNTANNLNSKTQLVTKVIQGQLPFLSKKNMSKLLSYNPWTIDISLILTHIQKEHKPELLESWIKEYNAWHIFHEKTETVRLIHHDGFVEFPNNLEIILKSCPGILIDKSMIVYEITTMFENVGVQLHDETDLIKFLYELKYNIKHYTGTLTDVCNNKINNIQSVIMLCVQQKNFVFMKQFRQFFMNNIKITKTVLDKLNIKDKESETIKEILNL